MEEKQAGITALITAYSRAYHATHDFPKIFDDYLADQMYTDEEHTNFDQNLAGLLPLINPELAASQPDPATALAWVMQLHNGPISLSRSRFTEDCLEEALRLGVQQYVNLGAGLDTFAFRRIDLADTLQIFEVDHPVTQDLKRQRVSIAGWPIPANLHLVSIDFNQDDLASTLQSSSFDPNKLTFISWLGVTYYLTREVVFSTLETLVGIALQGSPIVFDYLDQDAFIPEKTARRCQLLQSIARQVGEPMKSGFDPSDLNKDLQNIGFRLEENLSPAVIDQRYFQGRTDRYRAFEHIHFARAVIA
jgi:methyltransferase (TIGR00027 family)